VLVPAQFLISLDLITFFFFLAGKEAQSGEEGLLFGQTRPEGEAGTPTLTPPQQEKLLEKPEQSSAAAPTP
jgi:hypothetical protein